MSIAKAKYTADDLWNWPQDGMRHELINGEVTTMAPSGGEHGIAVSDIGILAGSFVRSRRLGVTMGAETGFIVSRDPDTVLAPDFAFVSTRRLPPKPYPSKYWPGVPDLAVEVISPSDRPKDVAAKAQTWVAAGASVVWVINTRQQTITVYAPDAQPQVLSAGDILNGGDVLPGLTLPLGEIFARP